MATRKKLTAGDLYPDHEINIEPDLAEEPAAAKPEKPARSSAPKKQDASAPRPVFVSLDELYELKDAALKKGWEDKAKDYDATIRSRLNDQFRKDNTINEILAEARAQRRKVHPFIITVGNCEELTLTHLDIGLRLNGLLDGVPLIGSNWREPSAAVVGSSSTVANRAVYSKHAKKRKQEPVKTFAPKTAKSTRPSGDGGMAARVDRLREGEHIWPAFMAATESEGERLTGKAGFSKVCESVIRGDSGMQTAIKAFLRGKNSVLIDAARSSMVAGLDEIAPMFARKS